MTYVYGEQKQQIFSEGGQVMFLAIRDNARNLIRKAGAATMERIIAGQCGDVWQMLACVDRLVELKELLEVPNTLSGAGQHRIFTSFDLS